jgi:histidinol dehydrogenase
VTTSPDSPARPKTPAVDFRTVDLRGRRLSLAELREAVPRARRQTVADAEQKVTDIITAVRQRGFAALANLARTFDGVEQAHPRVPAEALRPAVRSRAR